MWVEIKKAEFTSIYKGETYYFCAKSCKESFDQDPDYYMRGLNVENRETAIPAGCYLAVWAPTWYVNKRIWP